MILAALIGKKMKQNNLNVSRYNGYKNIIVFYHWSKSNHRTKYLILIKWQILSIILLILSMLLYLIVIFTHGKLTAGQLSKNLFTRGVNICRNVMPRQQKIWPQQPDLRGSVCYGISTLQSFSVLVCISSLMLYFYKCTMIEHGS